MSREQKRSACLKEGNAHEIGTLDLNEGIVLQQSRKRRIWKGFPRNEWITRGERGFSATIMIELDRRNFPHFTLYSSMAKVGLR